MITYKEVQAQIVSIYGARNEELGEAALLRGMVASITRLSKACRRRELPDSMVYDEVARIAARTFALAALLDFDLMEVVGHKWPGCCSHCHLTPCGCLNGKATRAKPPPIEMYSIENVQDMLHVIYRSVNAWNGVGKTLLHLFEEIGEVDEAMRRNREGIPSEVADVFAHICALANHSRLRVEGAVLDRYGNGCPHCHNPVCDCPIED